MENWQLMDAFQMNSSQKLGNQGSEKPSHCKSGIPHRKCGFRDFKCGLASCNPQPFALFLTAGHKKSPENPGFQYSMYLVSTVYFNV